jgi:hypothetical protein
LVFVFVSHDVFSQDSLSIYKWDVSSKKIGEGKYELIFSTTGVPGWQLYSPSQTAPDLTTTEIKFGDSTVDQQKNFAESGSSKEINSTPFDAKARVYEGPAEWKKQIIISGTVPAQLQGTLATAMDVRMNFIP